MAISVKTRKLLWAKSGSKCAFENCQIDLIIDATETDDYSIIGEECHIVAKNDNGPRGDENLAISKRDLYNNLILLCSNHHKKIDNQTSEYTIEKLREMKNKHEAWVKDNLNLKNKVIRDELIYSDYIDFWKEKADIDNWNAWTSNLLSDGQPSIVREKLQELKQLNKWLLSRIMPKRYLELENSFVNFMKISNNLIVLFEKHAVEAHGFLRTEKFYKHLNYFDAEKHNQLLKEYYFHVDLVQDLVLELTRAANLICEQVRLYIMSDFRLEEGLLLVTSGPHENFSYVTSKVEYTDKDRENKFYNTLEKFKIERQNRDMSFGKGFNVEESERLGVDY